MYVGITRARKELTMTMAAQRRAGGQMKTTTPSRFIDELPTEHIHAPGMKKSAAAHQPKKTAEDYLANIQALLKSKAAK